MGLETAAYLNDLVETNPVQYDAKSQGDDHLRMIKSVLKATFPGLAGAAFRTQVKSANYTVAATDNMSVINTNANITLALTAAATLGNKHMFLVVTSGYQVTIDPSGAETINGAATMTIPANTWAIIVCTGAAFIGLNADTSGSIIAALGYTPENAATAHVNTFNDRSGAVSLTSGDVTGALAYTPENAANNHVNTFNGRAGNVTLSSGDVTSALGYTPATSGSFVSTDSNFGVGSFAFAYCGASVAPGATVSGASLTRAGIWKATSTVEMGVATSGGTLSGTWRCMGYGYYSDNGGNPLYSTTLFQRIA